MPVDDHMPTAATVTDVTAEEWPAWCRRATDAMAGREMQLRFADRALGEVQLADDLPFVALEHDRLGASVALTIKYGDGVVPQRHVIADPQEVQQHEDADGSILGVTVLDRTGRRTVLSLS